MHQAFSARQRTLELDGLGPLALRMAYTDVGSGDPVVLLHGIPTWSFLYGDVIPLLEPHCRVIAPDFLGHGWSDRRDRFDRLAHGADRSRCWHCWTPGVQRATFVGHDTGGGWHSILGVEHPERVEGLVSLERGATTRADRRHDRPLRPVLARQTRLVRSRSS